jgi:hypothetical protein
VRNLFEAAVARQAGRVVKLPNHDADSLSTLLAVDIPPAGTPLEPTP